MSRCNTACTSCMKSCQVSFWIEFVLSAHLLWQGRDSDGRRVSIAHDVQEGSFAAIYFCASVLQAADFVTRPCALQGQGGVALHNPSSVTI